MTTVKNKTYFGYLLCSSPRTRNHELEHGVILVVSHTPDIAIGIQVNQAIPNQTLQEISGRIGIDIDGHDPIWFGGPNGQDRIHVIHSKDWSGRSTVSINEELSITNDISVLTALSAGEGPSTYRACAGYWSWEGMELAQSLSIRPSKKIMRNSMSWETVPATVDLVLSMQGGEQQWQEAIDASAHHQASLWF